MRTTVLVIDTIANNRVAFRVALSAAWYNVITSETWDDGLAQLEGARPGLVIVNSSKRARPPWGLRIYRSFHLSKPPITGTRFCARARML